MTWDGIGTFVGLTGTIVATVVALWSTLSAAGRPARLRRDETLLRGLLEASHEHDSRLLRARHRYVGAELVARHLTTPDYGARFGATCGVVFAGMAGVVGVGVAFAGVDPSTRSGTTGVWALLLGLLLGAACCFYAGGASLSQEVDRRNTLMHAILAGKTRYPLEAHRQRSAMTWKQLVLAVGATATLMGLSGAFFALAQIFTGGGGRYALLVLISLGLYLVGMACGGWAWRALVEPQPRFVYDEHGARAAHEPQPPANGAAATDPSLLRRLLGAGIGFWAGGR